MKTSSSLRRILSGSAAALLALTLGSQSAFAADGTWTLNGNGNWSDTANWSGGIIADGIGATATFSSALTTSNKNFTMDSSRTLGIWNLNCTGKSSNFLTSNGAVLTLDNTGSTDAQINVAAATVQNQTVSISIELMDSLVVNNALSAVSAKSLAFTAGISSKNGALTITNSSTDATSTTGYFGNISNGTGTVSFTSTNGISTLSGANTYTGATTITGGTISVIASSNLGAAASNLVFNGGTLRITGGALTNFSGIGHSVSFNATKTVGLDIADATHTFTADQVLNQTTGGLTKVGAGTLVLNQANTYTGVTTISAGVLVATTLDIGGNASGIGQATNAAANLVFGAPTATLRYTGSSNVTIDRSFTLSSGTGGGATIESSGTGTLSFDNTVALNYGTASQTRLLTLGGSNTGTNTFGKVIANNTSATSVTKVGDGTWILNQNNTYTGTTTVNGGTLLLDKTGTGALAATSALTLGGGTFSVKGATGAVATTQTLGSLVLTASTSSQIVLDPNGGTSTILTLGNAWTRNAGSSLLIDYSSANTGTREVRTAAVTTGYVASNLIYGGILVKDSAGVTGFATRAAGANIAITRFDDTTGTTLAAASNTAATNFTTLNTVYTSGTLTWTNAGALTARSVNTLTIDTTTNGGTIDMGVSTNVLTLTSLGMLFKGANNEILTGGQVGAAASEVIVHQIGSGTLTINSLISGTTGSLTKNGTGTLVLGGANAFTGGVTINAGTVRLGSTGALNSTAGSENAVTFGASSTGTLTLAGNSVVIGNLQTNAITPGTTFVQNANASNATLTVGNTTTNASGTYAGTIQNGTGGGTLALTKNGTGTLTLSGNNSYTGGTTLSGGIILANHNNALGSGTLTFNTSGTRLLIGDGVTVNNAIVIGANLGVTGLGLIQYSGVSSGTVSGPITINNTPSAGGHFASTLGGVLNVTGVITSSVIITQRAGTVVYSGGGTGYANINIQGGSAKLGANNGLSTTALVNIAGSQAATFDLAGFNQSVSGITRTNAFTAIIGNSSTTADSTLTTTGTSSYDAVIQDVISPGTRKVALTVNGGALTLSGTNTYTGGTLVSAGTLNLSHATDTLANGGAVTVSGGILAIAGNSDTVGTVSLTSGSITGSGGTLTGSSYDVRSGSVSAILGGSGVVLTKSTGGTVTLSGTNTYTGKSIVQNGTISFSAGNASATANQQLGTNAALDLGVVGTSSGRLLYTGGAGTLAKDINALGNGTDTIENTGGALLTLTGTLTKNGTTLTLKGGQFEISGTGTITGSSANSDLVVDAAAVTLLTANTYNGPTFIRNSSTLNANLASTLPTSIARTAVTFDGTGTSILSLGASQSIASLTAAGAATVTLGSNTLTIGTSSGSTTFAGAISGSGVSVVKDGASTQVFSGTNTYTGTATINAGTLQAGAAAGDQAFGSLSAVTLADVAGATLDLNNFNQTVGSLAGGGGTGGSVTLGSGTLTVGTASGSTTFAGVISGTSGSLVKNGASTQTLSGANTYTGTSTIRNGTVVVGVSDVAATSGAFGNASSDILLTDASSGASDNVSLLMNGALASSLTRNITVQNNATSGTTTIGTGPVNMQGVAANASAIFSGGITLAKNVTLANNFGGVNSNVIFSGVIGGTGDIFISANAANNRQLSFTSATGNTYVGKVWVGSGGLNAGVAAGNAITGDLEIKTGGKFTLNSASYFDQVADTSNVIVKSTSTWDGNSHNETIGTLEVFSGGLVTVSDAILTLNTAGTQLTMTGGSITVGGATLAGSLRLNGNASILSSSTQATIAATNGTTQINSFLDLRGGTRTFNVATGTGGAAGQELLVSAAMVDGTGTGAITKTGNGTMILSGSNTYTGGTAIDGGTLALGSAGALGTTGTVSFGGGTLQFSAANTTDYSARFSTAASQAYRLDTNGQTVTLGTALSSAGGSLTKSGNGTLTLTAAQGYATLNANGGTTNLNSTLGTGTSTLNANATVNIYASQTLAALNIADGVEVTFGDGLPFAGDGGKLTAGLVPEPGSLGLLCVGILGFCGRRRRA